MDAQENRLHARAWQAKSAESSAIAFGYMMADNLRAQSAGPQDNAAYFSRRAREHLFELIDAKPEVETRQ